MIVVLKQKQPVVFLPFFFLRCQLIVNERQKLHDDVYRIDASINFLAVFLSFMNQIFFE